MSIVRTFFIENDAEIFPIRYTFLKFMALSHTFSTFITLFILKHLFNYPITTDVESRLITTKIEVLFAHNYWLEVASSSISLWATQANALSNFFRCLWSQMTKQDINYCWHSFLQFYSLTKSSIFDQKWCKEPLLKGRPSTVELLI